MLIRRRRWRGGLATLASGGGLALVGSDAYAQKDPFDTKKQNEPPKASTSPAHVAQSVSAACEYLTNETCVKSNTGLIATSVGYVVGLVVLMTIVRAWWDKRGTSSAMVRFLVPCFLAAGGAGALVAFDPLRGQDLKCCLANAIFKAEILLQDSTAGRAVLLGVLPAVIIFLLVALIVRLIRR